MTLKNYIKYYFWASNRRKLIDNSLRKHIGVYCGDVIDIGGRTRGSFQPPLNKVRSWTYADIDKKYKPDIVLNVSNMKKVKSKSYDVVNAIELFEHVDEPEKGLKEINRILKNNGVLIISIPFLYKIHADPSDFQRWTIYKWTSILNKNGFILKEKEIQGLFFNQITDLLKNFIKIFPKIIVWPISFFLYPLLDLIRTLDDSEWVKNNKILNVYHGGYFFVAKKES